jgi:hypothetical protein
MYNKIKELMSDIAIGIFIASNSCGKVQQLFIGGLDYE